MANKKIEIFFPNTETENPIWEYENVTGYITIPPISMEDFITLITDKNKCESFPEITKVDNFSDQHGRLKDGRYEQTVTSGGSKSKKRRPKRRPKRISKKSCKRRK